MNVEQGLKNIEGTVSSFNIRHSLKAKALRRDVMLLDQEMPKMDGVDGINSLNAVLRARVSSRASGIASLVAASHEPASESQIGLKKNGVPFSDRLSRNHATSTFE